MARIGFGIKRLTPDSVNYAGQQPNPAISSNQQQQPLQRQQQPLQRQQQPLQRQQQPLQQPLQQAQQSVQGQQPDQITTNQPSTFMQQNSFQNNINRSVQPNPGQLGQKGGFQLNKALMKEDVAKKAAEVHQATVLKQQKMRFMKSFIELKRKIYQLIELGKPEEARDTYDNLFLLYQEMARSVREEEIVSIKTDIAVVYHNLEQAINKKKIKKGIFKEVENTKGNAERLYRDKIVTTDLDSIMQIVEEKGKMNLAEIETRFNITRRLAEEWIQILADYGLVEIKYLPIGGIEINKISK